MKNLIKYFLIISLPIIWFSCNSDDDSSATEVRPFAEVYAEDIAEIEDFLNTHYITVDADNNTEFIEIEEGGTETPISEMAELHEETVYITSHELTYKYYYLKFNEGVGESPTRVDSAYVSYKGTTFYESSDVEYQVDFDTRTSPIWFKLDEVVRGWGIILPKFKTGTSTVNGDGTVNYENYGFGVMFLPSGLGYYNSSVGSIPAYSPLIFNFKLHNLKYRDHDRDNVLSKYELGSLDYADPIDTDGDTYPDYLDPDDDGDGILTKNEVTYDTNGDVELPFADCDSDGVPNYLDTDSCP